MKYLIGIVMIVILGAGAFFFFGNATPPGTNNEEISQTTEGKTTVTPGSYEVIPAQSVVNWSAKKPFIEGYVNSGTIGISEGSIGVTSETASGSFTIDMNTLHVGLTAKKPGKEGALEAHLKKADFFDVEKFPTAEFEIADITAHGDSETTFLYTVHGNLTMKGVTNEISFPATIYLEDGALHAEAVTEIDRTKWGITYNSGSFFDNLADNVIDDMVAISFSLIAEAR